MELYVTSSDDSGPGSLRDTIAKAFSEELYTTIHLVRSIQEIRLVTQIEISVPILLQGNGVVISSLERVFVSKTDRVVLNDCRLVGGTTTENGGVIYCSLIDSLLSLTGCSLSGGSCRGSGGAVYTNGSAKLSSCRLFDNWSHEQGGAIHAEGSLTLEGCLLTRNLVSGTGGGGAVSVNSGRLILHETELRKNQAIRGKGGAVKMLDGDVYISSCRIVNNTALETPGVYILSGDLLLQGSSVSFNKAIERTSGVYNGGGVACLTGTVEIEQSQVESNTNGGVLVMGGDLHLSNSSIQGNSSTGMGGGICQVSGSLVMFRCTVEDNSAYCFGGGVAHLSNSRDSVTISESMICDNVLYYDYDICAGGGLSAPHGSKIEIVSSIVMGNICGKYVETGQTPTPAYGGGVYSKGKVRLEASRVKNNTASTSGGGLFSNREPSLFVSRLYGNSPDDVEIQPEKSKKTRRRYRSRTVDVERKRVVRTKRSMTI